jgi:ketosteroid isomerase-like protein
MPEQATEAIVSSYEALNRGDLEETIAILAPDVVWRESAQLPGAGELRGREAVREFLTDFLDSWERFEQTVERTVTEGDRVAVVIRARTVGRGSGAEVETRYAHVWTVRDGLGVCVDGYRDADEALEAVAP